MSTLHPSSTAGDERPLPAIVAAAVGLGVLLMTVATLLARPGAATAASDDSRPRVVSTVTMLTDVARQLAGADLIVEGLMQPGVDPHVWRPTRHDVVRLLEADLAVLIDLHLEAELLPALGRMERAGVAVWRAADALPPERLMIAGDAIEGAPSAHDPHVWMDPELFGIAIDGLASVMSELAPEAAERIELRRAALQRDLEEFDRFARASIESVPDSARVLVTAHDAFGYFGRRYGLEVLGLQGLSTESEAGLARVETLIRLLAERRIPAVFNESTVASRGVRSLIEGAAAHGHVVRLGGHLYADATGPAGSAAGTWLGMLEHDVRTIVTALGGRPAPLAPSPDIALADRAQSLIAGPQ